jgi:hypothetical protein
MYFQKMHVKFRIWLALSGNKSTFPWFLLMQELASTATTVIYCFYTISLNVPQTVFRKYSWWQMVTAGLYSTGYIRVFIILCKTRPISESTNNKATCPKVELYLHSHLCLHGTVLNYLSTGTTLPFTIESEMYKKYTEICMGCNIYTLPLETCYWLLYFIQLTY